MGIIQKGSLKPILIALVTVVITLAIALGGLVIADPVAARDGCPGDEFPGTGANASKCYRNQQIRNTTTQVATGNVVTPAASTTSPAPTTNTATPVTGGDATPDDSADDNSVTCAVEKIGWILCPIMEGAAKISDKAFDILADNFLRTDPELVQDDSGTKIAWEVSRNLANIMFIIAFLFIIFSQVTGRGLNNYGVKKMLPRLVIAAIAVNISYYICQLAVDATNILGYEIQNAMAQIANSVGPSVFGNVSNFADTQTANTGALEHGGILAIIVAGALAAGAVVWFMLPTIAALIPLILITVATIIIVLLLRKAFIVLLIVMAPVAFVMYLLPNTEKYFTKWMNMFTQLLMVFPIVALLFGAGQLASTVILVAGSNNGQAQAAADCNPDDVKSRQDFNDDKSTNDNSICGEKSVVIKGGKNGMNECFPGAGCRVNTPQTASWTMGLVATGIAVAPLLAVWAVLKGALAAAGAIGGKISGAVEKGTRAGVTGGVNTGKKRWERSAFGRGQALRKQAKEDYKNERFLEGLDDPSKAKGYERARRRYTRLAAGGLAGAADELGIQGTGSMQAQNTRLERAAAAGLAMKEKRVNEDIQAESINVNQMALGDHTTGEAGVLSELLNKDGTLRAGVDPNSARTAALIQKAMTAGAGEQKAAIIDAFRRTQDMHGQGSLGARTVASSLQSGANAGYYSASAIDAISRGAADKSAAAMTLEGLKGNKFNAEKMAAANADDTEWADKVADAAAAAGDTVARDLNRKNATEALTGTNTKGRIGSQRGGLMGMANKR